jgi:hypothetical protein
MLIEGFHKSFREIDIILKLQIEERRRVGSEHPVLNRPLLDCENVKLEYLCKKLNLAESSELSGKNRKETTIKIEMILKKNFYLRKLQKRVFVLSRHSYLFLTNG